MKGNRQRKILVRQCTLTRQMVTVGFCGKNKTACSILHHCLVVIKQLLKLF